MDPLTQGVLGAALPQATRRKVEVGLAGCLGFLSGMAADLDVLIRSGTDPLLFLDYHRHFTHSLVFIPVGGLLCALALHGLLGRRWRLPFARTLLFCTLGYATHAVLDAGTSYGTMLFWPFSDERYALSIVSVVDPLFTLPVAVLVVLAGLRRRPMLARLALVWAGLYLTLGAVQHQAARAMAAEIAAARGHQPSRIEVKPTFGNILLWKTVYETPERFHVDGVRPGVLRRVFPGTSIARLDRARDLPWLDPDTQQARDLERFRRFSDGFVARDPDHPDRIIDVRYSFLPTSVRGLWSIELSPGAAPDAHVRYRTHREQARDSLGRLWSMIAADGLAGPQ
ncbi:hypothetical protein GCM10017083_48900 [Thalassobaculum fulvum]|uniref:Metal-dependent hydrolase n=1 Tax=Thalassobaculum fulvum TaxID=1633335 RepID=A0A918XY01_9PROT|nr:metal-dependent hydrolase [Thalassobaculum fulvum]GHD61495.1 hypothetical protein GCM10017083_48900 [Thalassobaculum fulvum]